MTFKIIDDSSINNVKITTDLLTAGHLKIYLRLRYSSYKKAGEVARLSPIQVRQICNGFNLPKSPEMIKRIAEAWGIDAIILTQLFEKYREKKNVG